MSEWIAIVGTGLAGIITLSGTVFAVRQIWHLASPIKVKAGIKIVFDDIEQDEMQATILNRSRETQHVSRCVVRGTYSTRRVVSGELKKPRIRPRPYPNTRWGPFVYDMLGSKSLKLEPFESVTVSRNLSSSPLELYVTPYLQVEVKLSTERVFRSGRIQVPDRWKQVTWRKIDAMKAQQSAAADAAKPRG